MEVRRQIDVAGIVQGVGFRPYIYRLASERNLPAACRNSPAGVTIEVQGPVEAVEEFVSRLPRKAPPLSQHHAKCGCTKCPATAIANSAL